MPTAIPSLCTISSSPIRNDRLAAGLLSCGFSFSTNCGILVETIPKEGFSVGKKRLGYEPPDAARNRWKTILVIVCALIVGMLLGLTMRHLI